MRRLADATLVTAMAVMILATSTGASSARAADSADLAAAVAGAPAAAGAGSELTYRVSVTNAGPAPAADAALSLEIPNGTRFASFSAPDGWAADTPTTGGAGTVTATAPSLAPGGSASFTLVITVDTDIAQGTTVRLVATVDSATTDPNPGDNTAAIATEIRDAADLALTVVADPEPVSVGTDLRYRITLTNAGPASAARVVLTMTTPAGTAFASFIAPPDWTSATPPVAGAGVVTTAAQTLPVGGKVTFDLVVTVLPTTGQGAQLDLTPTVTSATPDPQGGNNTATARTTVANVADLAVSVSDDRDVASPAATVTYTVTVTNNGPAAALGATLSIGLVTGAGFVSFTAPAGWASSTPSVGAAGTVSATANDLAAGRSAAFALALTPDATGELSVTATVRSSTTDPVPGNDSATETTSISSASASPSSSGVKRGGLPLGTSLIRLGGATAVLVGLALLSLARGRARRARLARRGYR